MKQWVVFDIDSIERLSASEARLLGSLGKLTEALGCLAPTLATVLERYAGAPSRVRFVSPVVPVDTSAPLPGPGFEGVAVRIRCLAPPLSLMALVPGALCDRLVMAVLGCPARSPIPEPEVRQAVLTHVIVDVLRALPVDTGVARLGGLATITPADTPEFLPDSRVLYAKIRLGDHRDLVTLVIQDDSLTTMCQSDWVARTIESRAAARSLRYDVSLAVGKTVVSSAQIRGLEPTDLIVLDRVAPGWSENGEGHERQGDLCVRTRARDHFLARVACSPGRMVVMQGGPVVMEGDMKMEDERTMADGSSMPSSDGGAKESLLDDLPVCIVVEAGRATMTVDELLSLSAGTVIPLSRPSSAQVTLTAAGRELAHGVLVQIEGELGVKVLKVLR